MAKEIKPGSFLIGLSSGNSYGIPLNSIRDVLRGSDIKDGSIVFREKEIPVWNLGEALHGKADAHTEHSIVVVLGEEKDFFGIVMGNNSGVHDFAADEIAPAPEKNSELPVLGMGEKENISAFLLDPLTAPYFTKKRKAA